MLAEDMHHTAALELDRDVVQDVTQPEAEEVAGLSRRGRGLEEAAIFHPGRDQATALRACPIAVALGNIQLHRQQPGRLVDVGHRDLATQLRSTGGRDGGRFEQGEFFGRDHFLAPVALRCGMMKLGLMAGMNSKPRKLSPLANLPRHVAPWRSQPGTAVIALPATSALGRSSVSEI